MSERPDSFIHQLSAEVHRELIAEFGMETEAWVGERLTRVMARLNAVRTDCAPLTAHCLVMRACTAFTIPGEHVYVARVLLERLADDEATAWVLAHEVAHHDLGHMALHRGWTELLPRGAVGSVAAALFRNLSHQLYGPTRETQADQYALELCLDAGYDGARCLRALDVLEMESLNRGDVDGVFGPENLLDPTDPEQGGTAYAIQRWVWTHSHRYLPLRERREIAWSYLRRRLVERGEVSVGNVAERS